jgi:septal ring factor EnvC (AmiA/AmiB activator)
MHNSSIRTVLAFSLFFLIIFTFCPLQSDVSAASPKKKLSEIERKIKKKKQSVASALKKEQSILSRIENIERGIKGKKAELKKYEGLITKARTDIIKLNRDIKKLKKKLDLRREFLKERLRVLYKQQYGGNALILISARDYQDLIRKSKYLSLIAYRDSRTMEKYSSAIRDIQFKKKKLGVLQSKLESSKKEAKQKQKALQTDRIKKDRLLTTIRSKRSTYEKTIKELEASSEKLKEMIKKMREKKLAKSFVGKSFSARRGHLPWPVSGKVVVPFGKYKDPKFKIIVFKNGIEIKTDIGEEPQAIASGRVVFADVFQGYGQLLIIAHGDGFHSLYGHLSEIFHKTGDIIIRGTSLGRVGDSSLLLYPTLYFEIRLKGKPVNPLKWLKSKRRIVKKN